MNTLPRFSNPKDVDEFVETLARFERGEISSEAFRAFRLTRGVYGQRQDDVQMLRVKIPAGLLGPEQLEALADVADRYGRGLGHVTTRQNVQFHFLKMADVEAAMRRCDEAGLTTREACGNSVRTVTACEVAEVCGAAPFDVTPYAEAVTRYFLGHPLSASLPRKFKTAFSGCASDCAKAAIHDLGFVAAVREGERGFKVLAAGGLSTSPQAALALHEFVPAGEIGRVAEALVRLFHRLGNRDNRHRARLKYVLRKLGEEKFRAAYAEVRAEVDAEARGELTLPPPPAREPAPPRRSLGPTPPGLLLWQAASTFTQKQASHVAVYVRLALGDITSAQMRALANVCRRYGDGSLRLTIDQNLLLPWVDRRSLAALYAELEPIGLARPDVRTAHDVTSCPGADSCNLAVTASRRLAAAVAERLERPDARALEGLAGASIKVSGCPNSCGQHHIADLGFHGGVKTVGGASVPVYQLHLGGGVDGAGARFGKQVVKIVARRVPDAVVRLFELYGRERAEGEAPAAFFARVDPKAVVAALGPLVNGAPEPDERSDFGETEGFLVATRDGECAA
jgi:sulfite reductase beta subunit-like hemoprotein